MKRIWIGKVLKIEQEGIRQENKYCVSDFQFHIASKLCIISFFITVYYGLVNVVKTFDCSVCVPNESFLINAW